MIFTIALPVVDILHQVWGNMTFVVGQVDDTPPKPKLVTDRHSFHTLWVVSRVILSDHMKKKIYYKILTLSTTI